MRNLSPEVTAALENSRLIARDFLYITARTRDEVPEPVSVGFWSGLETIQIAVINPDTDTPELRTYLGAGTLVQISDIPLVSSLTIQSIDITLTQMLDAVNQAVREYECKQARVEVHRGLWDPVTLSLVDYPYIRFLGFVDEAPITTPAEGNDGNVTFTCTSNTQEISRSNPDTRSLASQLLREDTDNFHADAGTIHEREFWWGQAKGKVETVPGVTAISITTWKGTEGGAAGGMIPGGGRGGL